MWFWLCCVTIVTCTSLPSPVLLYIYFHLCSLCFKPQTSREMLDRTNCDWNIPPLWTRCGTPVFLEIYSSEQLTLVRSRSSFVPVPLLTCETSFLVVHLRDPSCKSLQIFPFRPQSNTSRASRSDYSNQSSITVVLELLSHC